MPQPSTSSPAAPDAGADELERPLRVGSDEVLAAQPETPGAARERDLVDAAVAGPPPRPAPGLTRGVQCRVVVDAVAMR